jgi:hypothetical protein
MGNVTVGMASTANSQAPSICKLILSSLYINSVTRWKSAAAPSSTECNYPLAIQLIESMPLTEKLPLVPIPNWFGPIHILTILILSFIPLLGPLSDHFPMIFVSDMFT